ncbi:MAG: glycoside hydrolase/deacetylase [Paenibacillus sp.]|nr:glycoside hydrolase/deacetylase [Paenibacillus sp.]
MKLLTSAIVVMVTVGCLGLTGCRIGQEATKASNELPAGGVAHIEANAGMPQTPDPAAGAASDTGNSTGSENGSSGRQTGSSGATEAGGGSSSYAAQPYADAGRQDGQSNEDEKDWPVYRGPIEHIFFHPLIAYPELAFDGDRMSQGYDDWFVTVQEFDKIIESLYKNNYMLIDLNAIFEMKESNGKVEMERKELRIPKGKKPLVLSIDDMNYYDYMREDGNVYKLVLDAKGDVATYTVKPQGGELVSHDNEIVPILDEFVKKHSDFSLHGAKGLIALTGYQGILGYRTNETESPDYSKEKAAVLKVIKRLKETGWSFASHGYDHLDARKASNDRFMTDTAKWKEEVESLIGPTVIYVYPYGSSVLPGDPKYTALLNAGFHVLCSVGPTPYLKWMSDSLMMDRRHIDGMALQSQGEKLLNLFDANEVVDHVRPAFRSELH